MSVHVDNVVPSETPIEIFGHRGVGCSIVGGNSEFPENSMDAFQHACDSGINGVEIDVWLTKDHQVIVIHGGGTDLDGFLYETVVDLQYHIDETNKRNIEENSSIQLPSTISKRSMSSNCNQSCHLRIAEKSRFRRIEDISYAELRDAGQLRLKQPWSVFKWKKASKNNVMCDEGPPRQMTSYDQPINYDLQTTLQHLSTTDYGEDQFHYYKDIVPHTDATTSSFSEVPLLSDVFRQFYGKLRFNVELKGTNPNLGLAVLDIAKPYPGVIARISSFLWLPDQDVTDCKDDCCEQLLLTMSESRIHGSPTTTTLDSNLWFQVHNYPNGVVPNDLLLPIKKHGVPIALLFGGYFIPSISRVLECLKKYDSTWIHLPQGFLIADFNDQGTLRTLEEQFVESHPRIRSLLEALPEMSDEKESNFSRSQILLEMLHLYQITNVLNQNNIKVLVYGSHSHENRIVMELCLLCGIQGICPNDVKLALQLTKEIYKTRRHGMQASS